MKLTLMLKLLPTQAQADALLQTMQRFNAACDAIAGVAFEHRVANKVRLQRLCYYHIRQRFGLPSQLTVRALAKVAEAYKRDKSIKPAFRRYGAVVYDQRLLSFKGLETGLDTASILTLQGRQLVPFVMGRYQRERIAAYGVRGQAKLLYRRGSFYLAVVVEAPEPRPKPEGSDFLGVDLGIVSLAFDSDGESYSGQLVEQKRRVHAHRRRNLQRKRTRSATRKLHKLSGKQARFQRNTNHIISKRLVQKAKDTERGIALENLTGIRARITVSKPQRSKHANWAFYQLRSFIQYKAAVAGVAIALVDPRNTSRQCSECGYTDKANRWSQSLFECGQCQYSALADYNAALNLRLRARAAVILPNGGSTPTGGMPTKVASSVAVQLQAAPL